ncbi:MAG: AAA-like domain-containing protein [Verrucomicrobiales bacterium]|nr:AAA-like domain-containing protein [Verrucomicrobiales bacterium]
MLNRAPQERRTPGPNERGTEEFPFIPDHQLLRCIGSGSYGKVWLARNVIGAYRAVKVIHRKTFAEERPYEREFAGIKKFEPLSRTHPSVISVLHIGRNDSMGYFYYIMELADDVAAREEILPEEYVPRTLQSDLAQQQKLPLVKCLEISVSLAAGLHHLHKNGLVHRDVKPSNIIFLHGAPKFADIGLVTDIGEAATFVGTEGYVPREGPGKPLADIYSLGKVCYEMATGKDVRDFPEFPTPTDESHDRRCQKFHQIILQACHSNPAKRFRSAELLHQQLSDLLGSSQRGGAYPPSAGPPSPSRSERGTVGIIADHSTPLDRSLAAFLQERFAKERFCVMPDTHPRGGMEWARRVEARIARADALVVLLSAQSVQSEMLAYELEMARDAAQQRQGKPRLIGVRIQSREPLPENLSGLLEAPCAVHWEGPQDDERVANEMLQALISNPQETQRLHRPELETVGGAVPLDSAFYVVRNVDEEFESALAKHDSVVLVKGARQMGKSSLLARGLQQARDRGFKVIHTDFQKLNVNSFESLDKLYVTLSHSIADQLHLDEFLEDVWDRRRSANTNFERFIRRAVLAKVSPHLVWGMDEADRLFGRPFSSEFFGLLRSWHNDRALDPTAPWSRLTMAIAYATEAHLFISDLNQSPFNVGTRLALRDFSAAQVAELNRRYDRPLQSAADLGRFIRLIGGQPFLVRKALNEFAAREWTITAFEAEADSDDGIFADHLRRMLVSLTKDAGMIEAVRRVLRGQPALTAEQFYRLRSAGVLVGESARIARPRCQLYANYLRRHLLSR